MFNHLKYSTDQKMDWKTSAHGNKVTKNSNCKRNWEEIDDGASEIIIIDDDSDSYTTAKNPLGNSFRKDLRYLPTKMSNDLAPTSEIKSADPLASDSLHASFDDEECSEMTQSERKRYREKKRRSAITNAVDNLSKVLSKVDRNSLVDKDGAPFGYLSSLNRTGTINRAARVLETLHKENEERKVQVTKLTALLREVSNGSVQFERTPQPPQTSICQYLTALLNSAQQIPQPAPFITVQSGLSLQAHAPNQLPLSISRSTIENLIAFQCQSLENKKRRRGDVYEEQVPGRIQCTTADNVGGTGDQQKIFLSGSGTPPHVPSQTMR